ncbi:ASKHA domain-containing protein [Natronospora cellulosivora (SeqCode)]
MKYSVLINNETTLKAKEGQNLLNLLRKNNINISSPCGGKKSCGKCKLRVLDGDSKISDSELSLLSENEIKNGYRLACCISIFSDLSIELLKEEAIKVMTDALDVELRFDPSLNLYSFSKEELDSEESSTYLDFLYNKSTTNNIDISSIKDLSEIIDEEIISCITFDSKILKVSKEKVEKLYGIAVDIGTTTVALYLIDLLTGKEIDVYSFHNPQKKYGADVISRINYTQTDGKVSELQEEIIRALNKAISEICSKNNIHRDDIYQATIVANTVMIHFLLGVKANSIARAPYRPIFTNSMQLSASEINLSINPEGVIQILPSISAYLGSDITADLLVTDFNTKEWKLLIDIGTNGEIVLGNKDKLIACSTAAGPAFEGAKIAFGMAGVSGAISKFEISDKKEFLYETIDFIDAKGICGSALIDIVGEFVEKEIITRTGSFNNDMDEKFMDYMTTYQNMQAIKIAPLDSISLTKDSIDDSILITQKDIRELQLAKGAIAAGINILLKEAGIDFSEINNIYLAGGFGSFIDPVNACIIGLLPEKMGDKVVKIGNGAGLGAKACLYDKEQLLRAERIVKQVEYIDLSLRADFQDEFLMSLEF